MAGTGAASPRPPELHQDQDQDLNPYLKEHRLATFAQWPFVSDCSCTPDRMAEAGFIHCPNENAPDVVQCLFCWKELEGWEPDDDPMEEHRCHSPNCPFLALQKDVCDLTVREFLKLSEERLKGLVKKEIDKKVAAVEKNASIVRAEIERLHA
ncbi:baculoviral IAP repeat-containing protein 5 isoform X1 [Hemicordylus capensis]|uniref:baculoviral IAP repeat-containing protein 5 isoform X1 n=1 Tax=Hemicordylus capensis TaxID=884348 RepID=UPI00230401EA|nr:baculoviral IAP repeat-containing protein 5 isoform X1 [Hemicordylus capensis]